MKVTAKANKRPPFGKYLKEQLKTRPAVTTIMVLYLAFCLASSIYLPISGRARDGGYSLVYAAVVPLFYVAEYFTRQKTPWLCVAFIMFWLFGSFIGACYNVYTLFEIAGVKCWDDIMHFCWGIVFAAAGFAVIKMFIGEPDNNKKFFACIIFALAFCLMIAVFWEIYEFTVDSISPNYDMQEDTIVTRIHSFFLHKPYDHLNTEIIDGIAYTKLYDAEGNLLYTIEGGYLDIGIMDTMWDIIWCTVSAAVLCIALIADRFLGKHFYKIMIPAVPVKLAENNNAVSDGTAQQTDESAEVNEETAAPADEVIAEENADKPENN